MKETDARPTMQSKVKFPDSFTEEEKQELLKLLVSEDNVERYKEGDPKAPFEQTFLELLVAHGAPIADFPLYINKDNFCGDRTPHSLECRVSRLKARLRKSAESAVKSGAAFADEKPHTFGKKDKFKEKAAQAETIAEDIQSFSEKVMLANGREIPIAEDVVNIIDMLKGRHLKGVPRMMEIGDFAYHWGCSIDEAINKLNGLISARCIPIVLTGTGRSTRVRLVSPDDADDVNAAPIIINNVNEEVFENGIKCTRLGIVSDTHFGSNSTEYELLQHYYYTAYKMGVRTFLHAGDWFDGSCVYPGQKYEQKEISFDQQVSKAVLYYPRPGNDVVTYGIIGNHDEGFLKTIGANPMRLLSLSRPDIKSVGRYQAYLKINGFNINLHHGAGGCNMSNAEATLHRLARPKGEQAYIRNLDIIDLVVLGHFHTKGEIEPFDGRVRKVIFGGSFQNATAFTQRHNFNPYIGGFVANLYSYPDGEHKTQIVPIEYPVPKLCTEAIEFDDYARGFGR